MIQCPACNERIAVDIQEIDSSNLKLVDPIQKPPTTQESNPQAALIDENKKNLNLLAKLCFEAEEAALSDGGPKGLTHAWFTLPVEGLGPGAGPRVWVLPDLFGTISIILPGAKSQMVKVGCSDVRAYFVKLRKTESGAPLMGIDPGLLSQSFLRALGAKDPDDKSMDAERIARAERDLKVLGEINKAAQESRGE